jgi:hypothetical protein
LSNNAAIPAPAGSHILLPRFVAYDAARPDRFHTSFIETGTDSASGLTLKMPDFLEMVGDSLNPVSPIDLRTLDPNASVNVLIRVDDPLARVKVSLAGIPEGAVQLQDNDSQSLTMSGKIEHLRTALDSLTYQPATYFYGNDSISAIARNDALKASATTRLKIAPNCAGENGTAIRFDLGEIDPASGRFIVHLYLTTISVQTEHFPQRFYGFCKSGVRYDRDDGLVSITRNESNTKLVKLCQEPDVPDNKSHPYWPYVQNSPAIPYAKPKSITVILLEQTNNNTPNRYSLVFVFDDANTPGLNKKIKVQFNNLEPSRDLTDTSDVYTFADDEGEYESGRISATGSIIAHPEWQRAHDGFVLPLKLPDGAVGENGIYDLKFYDQRPPGSTAPSPNPNLNIISTNSLDRWNIRSRISDEDGSRVEFVEIPFDMTSTNPKTAIQIRVSEAAPCASAEEPQDPEG